MNANDDETSGPSPVDPFELLNQEPAEASSLRDSFLVEYFKSRHLTDDAANALAAEIWLRHWLYAGKCASTIEQTIASAQASNQAGFSEQFSAEYERLLTPIRKNDDGKVIPKPQNLDDREKRIWGFLVTRVLEFLEADGLMALIPQDTHTDDDGVAVPFRFFPSEQSSCQDKNGDILAGCDWLEVLEDLGDLGPFGDNQVLRVEAVFPSSTPPGGASIGLAVALAWARRQARDLPLFSPLAVMATGKLKETEEKISAVDGTGGQADTDTQGGAKGQLALRLGVNIYVAADASNSFSAGNEIKVCSFTSSTQWKDALCQIVQAVGELKLTDSPRHLQRVESEDPELISSGKASEAQLWACWRRLGRLQEHSQSANFDKIHAWRRNAVLKLGYKSIVPGFYDFSIVEDRHGRELRGRRLELQRLDDFLSNPGGMLPVTGPVGHGKSALLTRWRLQFPTNGKLSVFFHYFDQNDDRLRSRAVFYRRLIEHLLIEVEGRPTNREPTEQDVLEAWHLWEQKENRRPLVLVIDGLDEAEQCPPPFPNIFPQNVWLVVSCRSRQGSAQHSAIDSWGKRAGAVCHKPLEVGPLDIPNLCSWLATLVADWTPTLPVVQNLAAKVFDRTGGMALFIHHLWDDLREAITKGQDLNAVLEKTPVGFVEYLQTQWQRLNDDALEHEKSRLALKIVGYLIAAKGPLNNRELVNLLDLEPGMDLTNLPREAQRWVAVRLVASTDAWGTHFFLNHWLVREAIGSRLRPEVYGGKLVDQCRSNWRDGSPYALRHLPDHLMENGLWRELDGLVNGADAVAFQRLQAQVFTDEPALLLASVRRALEIEVTEHQPNISTVAELSLTQATLIHRLAKPVTQTTADELSSLDIAQQMARLPVQWDPTADFMWHLVAAWQLNKEGRSAERNLHLNALGSVRDLRLPTSWGLLAAAILTETVSPFNPLLKYLSEQHVLSLDAVAELVGRFAKKGESGRRAALQWLHFNSKTNRANSEMSHYDTALRRCVVFGLAQSGFWGQAEMLARAAATITEQATLLLNLAELAENDLDRTDNLRQWIDYLEPYVEHMQLSTSEYLRINSILGRISAIRARHHLLRGHNEAPDLVRQAEGFVRGKMFVRGAGPFDVQAALALAYAKATSCREVKRRSMLIASARLHRREAFRAWMNLRRDPKAATVEIFQIWLWFADLTFKLVSFGVLPIKIGKLWEARLRRLLLSKSSGIFNLLNAGRETASSSDLTGELDRYELRYLEPVEWDHSIVVAIEAMVATDGFTNAEILQVIGRCINAAHRARGLSRWIQKLVETGTIRDAEESLRYAIDNRDLRREDVAAAHVLITNNLLTSRDHSAATHHAVIAIQYGTDTLWGPNSIQLIELLANLSCVSDRYGDDFFSQAVQMVQDRHARFRISDEEKAFTFLTLAETAHYREGAAGSNSWFNEVWKLQEAGGGSYLSRKRTVTILCQYARRLHLLKFNERAQAGALSRALGAARGERSLIHRCELLCEVAEAFAYCGDQQRTSEVFADMQSELPATIPIGKFPHGFLWRKQGVKPQLIRGHCLAEMILGLGKVAIQQASLSRPEAKRAATNYVFPWSEWTWEGGGLSSIQRTNVRHIYAELLLGTYSLALKRAMKAFTNHAKTVALRSAICREIIGALPWLEWIESHSLTSNQRKNISIIYDYLCAGNLVAAIGHTNCLTSDDNDPPALRVAVCRELGKYLNWSDWALSYSADQGLQKHDEAMRGFALASAAQGIWGADFGVWSFVKRITAPSISASTIRDLAEFSAANGNVDEVLKRAKNLMASREKDRVLHRIASALSTRFKTATTQAEKVAVKKAIYELVPSCAEFFGSTYLMLGCLVEIEPAKWRSIAEVLAARRIISLQDKSTTVH